jgi:hypothetical protein
MYATLMTRIKTTLQKVVDSGELAQYFNYPKTKLDEYPAVYFQPNGFDNNFETESQNMKIYRFLMVVIVNKSGTTTEEVFSTILPNVVDAIVAQFDTDWNQGTIDGGRVWAKIDTADPWEYDEDQDGLTAYAPLNLEIKLVSNN